MRQAHRPGQARPIRGEMRPSPPRRATIPTPAVRLAWSATARDASETVASAGQPTTAPSATERASRPERLEIQLNRAIPRPA